MQVFPDSSTPPQTLCSSITAGEQSPIAPAAATLQQAAQHSTQEVFCPS